MPAGSALYITSADRKSFTVSPSNRMESSSCDTSTSEIVVVGPPSGADSVTVTITPSSTTCSGGGGGGVSSGGGGSSSGGGGGGAGSSSTATTPAPAASPVAVVATAVSSELRQIVDLFIALGIIPADKAEKARSVLAQQSPSTTVSGTFSRALGKGTSHADVKRLQQLLNSDSDTRVVSIGAGSPGSESQFFGALTEKAVQKFQVKYGIAKTGEPGYGFVGPKTRAKLKEAFGQ